jgi:cyclase
MLNFTMVFRVIARLDVKPPHLVKGVHMEGLRKVGEPGEFARAYYLQGADEINYQDIVASLYGRNGIGDLVSTTAKSVFVPITVGGGLRTVSDAAQMVRNGADKVCINTAVINSPNLATDVGNLLGSQALVVGIEAKKLNGTWIAMTDCGREHTGKNVFEWAEKVEELGAGEILLTSIDQEGTFAGFDLNLIASVRNVTRLPIIAHGGAGHPSDALKALDAGANAIAIASVLHYGRYTIMDFKETLHSAGIEVRI